MKAIKLRDNINALIDNKDYPLVKDWKWSLSSTGYAVRRQRFGLRKLGKGKMVYLHRFILNAPRRAKIDHINGNKLDDRRKNLRFARQIDNNCNRPKFKGSYTSIYKGVYFDKQGGKWRARIKYKGKTYRLGDFKIERHAAMAYDMWVGSIQGKFANKNFKSI